MPRAEVGGLADFSAAPRKSENQQAGGNDDHQARGSLHQRQIAVVAVEHPLHIGIDVGAWPRQYPACHARLCAGAISRNETSLKTRWL